MTNVVVDPNDPWALASGSKYSQDRVYVKATDGKGHKDMIQCPMPPSLFGEIHALVASRFVPEYRTAQDFIRDACIHRMKYWADKSGNGVLGAAIDEEMMLAEVRRAKYSRENKLAVIQHFKDEFRDSSLASDWTRIADLANDAMTFADLLPDPYAEVLRELGNDMERFVRGKVQDRSHVIVIEND